MVVASQIIDGTKRCGKCEVWKPVDDFYRNKNSATGLASWCRDCMRSSRKADLRRGRKQSPEKWKAYRARYHAKYPDRIKAGYRKQNMRKYGVTIEWYEQKMLEQDGRCRICRQPETAVEKRTGLAKGLAVDHCHVSSKARGLLCTRCNTALGLLQDNPDLLRAAANYLEEQS